MALPTYIDSLLAVESGTTTELPIHDTDHRDDDDVHWTAAKTSAFSTVQTKVNSAKKYAFTEADGFITISEAAL